MMTAIEDIQRLRDHDVLFVACGGGYTFNLAFNPSGTYLYCKYMSKNEFMTKLLLVAQSKTCAFI